MKDTTKPGALRLADHLERFRSFPDDLAAAAAAELRRLYAEIEALRAEVERLRTDGASAVRWAPGSAYWSDVLRELFGPNARDGINVVETRWRAELERADTAEALLRQALEVLSRAHQTAMEQTLRARVPECSAFAGIAQDLDFVVAALRERLGEKA